MKKMKLVRTFIQEREQKRLFYSIGVDSRRTKGKRETKDHLEKDCGEGEKQGRWKSWNVAKAAAQNRECWSENVSPLCAYWRAEIG